MGDISYSVDCVRDALWTECPLPERRRHQAAVAFEVIMEEREALGELLRAAMERSHDAELALSALRHPSDTVEQLKRTLRKLADLECDGRPISPAFEQVMDELIAEVQLHCAVPPGSSEDASLSSVGHG